MVGHDVYIDLYELKFGHDIVEFIDDAIAGSHTVIVIYSKNTQGAIWQRLEISAALWNSISQDGGSVIVLKYGPVTLPPLLGARVYGRVDDGHYQHTLEELCSQIANQISETSTISEALKEDSSNPFWRVRAEYFDEDNPRLLASSFSPPDAAKIRVLEEMKPCFLEGSRGTGKTMLLLSLRARILSARSDSSKSLHNLFGCYVRLDRGAFCNAGRRLTSHDVSAELDLKTLIQLTDVFAQEFYLGVIESLVSEISHCARSSRLEFDGASETTLIRSIARVLSRPSVASLARFDDLLEHFADMHLRLSEFVRRRFIYDEPTTIPFVCFDLPTFRRVVNLIRTKVPHLSTSQITILLDEYENLLAYQKVVVNSLIKLGPPTISVKVARKVGSQEVSDTTEGQELQETHDYNRVTLIYSVESDADFARYIGLLENMVGKLLTTREGAPARLADLLPDSSDDEVPREKIVEETLRLLRIDREEFDSWSAQIQDEKLSYYREAAIYRQLYGSPGRRTKKRFSGHKELAFISSGVIRFFQEILVMAYHLQSSKTNEFLSIDPRLQSEAVHIVSVHNLATLSRNVETYGEQLKYFLLDLGDCLRQKLLHHSSEPEAARLSIRDPQVLLHDDYQLLKRMIGIGIKEGVFQVVEGRSGIRPKHVEDPQPMEINISRIFAPSLEISPRLRWRTRVGCSELLGLLDAESRRTTKSRLVGSWAQRKHQGEPNAQLPFEESGR